MNHGRVWLAAGLIWLLIGVAAMGASFWVAYETLNAIVGLIP